jgi:hypothetical protein
MSLKSLLSEFLGEGKMVRVSRSAVNKNSRLLTGWEYLEKWNMIK